MIADAFLHGMLLCMGVSKHTVAVVFLGHDLEFFAHICIGAGAYSGCTYCTHKGKYSKVLQKVIYPGNRSFLPENDGLRHDTNFPGHMAETANPPDMKTMEYVDKANARYSAASTEQDRKELAQETGCKGSYSLRKLPLHERILNTPVEPMHLIKNIVAHCIDLITGNEDSYKMAS